MLTHLLHNDCLVKSVHLIVIHKDNGFSVKRGYDLLRAVMSYSPAAEIVLEELSKRYCFSGGGRTNIALPGEWNIEPLCRGVKSILYYSQHSDHLEFTDDFKIKDVRLLSNGRYITNMDRRYICGLLSEIDADVIAVKIDPSLLSYHEQVRLTGDGQVGGFRRYYSDSIVPTSVSLDWPHHLFFKYGAFGKILAGGVLPNSFGEFLNRCKSKSLRWISLSVGGISFDLDTASGLLSFINAKAYSVSHRLNNHQMGHNGFYYGGGCMIDTDARLFGRVIAGRGVCIDSNAIVAGPTILCDGVSIGRGAVVRSSIIGPGVLIREGFLQNRIVFKHMLQSNERFSQAMINAGIEQSLGRFRPFFANGGKSSKFRIWPRISYAGFLKRAADILASLSVLILFAPVFPIIALAIKLNSRGPIFFKHKRQMRYGKEFSCLKFRTMVAGADSIQEKLRFKNEVDGPQFKVEKDPRVTVVGRFLRNTYIDEIPQFINILLGHMSVVGPRPSPESENSICPNWRDARLSVRPGITGLWQICRTRRPGRDFQEWIYYDTQYVKNLSWGLDLWICWRTAKKLIINFIEQF